MPSAECLIEHHLVRIISSLYLFLSQIENEKILLLKTTSKVSKIQDSKVMLEKNRSKLDNIDQSGELCLEALWRKIKNAAKSSSGEILGFSMRKNHDWFDENHAE